MPTLLCPCGCYLEAQDDQTLSDLAREVLIRKYLAPEPTIEPFHEIVTTRSHTLEYAEAYSQDEHRSA